MRAVITERRRAATMAKRACGQVHRRFIPAAVAARTHTLALELVGAAARVSSGA